jgi:hypothetical protein
MISHETAIKIGINYEEIHHPNHNQLHYFMKNNNGSTMDEN